MTQRLLLLGASGKMGTAINRVLGQDYTVLPKTSQDFDAENFDQVRDMVKAEKPDIIFNAVAMMGIDNCESNPEQAFRLNTLFPKILAELADERDALLAHFSTSAVFDGKKHDDYHENDIPAPLNVYGATKFGGDTLIMASCRRHYIFRIPITFGPTNSPDQFTERMLSCARTGQPLRISDDIYESPSYSIDIAEEIGHVLDEEMPYGLYHITNRGKTSLYDLVMYLTKAAGVDAHVERASYRDFLHHGRKNTYTPLTSVRLNPLRSWQRAADDFVKIWLPEAEQS